MAALETRLRSAITELVQPTIQRTTLVVQDLESVKSQVSQHTRGLQEVQLGQFKVVEQMAMIASFKEEMVKWDQQRRAHESSIDDKVEVVLQRLESYRFSLEQKESALHHLHRSIDRLGTEVNHTMDEQETQKDHFEKRLDEESRKLNHFKAEVEVKLAGIELKHNALTDELWGEETGLAKVAGELKKTKALFANLEDAVAEMKESKAEAALLDKLRRDVGKLVYEANTSVSAMRQSVGNVVNDVREHFRTASQTIAAHNATFVSEIRQGYQAELASAKTLREEVQKFMEQVATNIDGLDARVAGASAKADSLAAEAREEVEELNRRRKVDKSTADNELKALKRRLSGVFENSDNLMRGMEHIYGIVRAMVESELMQCSLEWQDTVDRKKIALIGVKDEETTLARSSMSEPIKPRPEFRQKEALSMKKGGGVLRGGPGTMSKPQEPVIHVDNRCASCSGQAPLVLSAFKMACLKYTPSPVEHSGTYFERGELLKQRHGLLDSAHQQLQEGPRGTREGASPASPESISPGGGGGSGGGAGGAGGLLLADYAALESRMAKVPTAASPNSSSSVVRLPNLAQTSGALTAR